MTYKKWSEAEHPRDDNGKFTFKNGGKSVSKQNEREQKLQKRADVLYPTMKDKENLVEQTSNTAKQADTKLGGDAQKKKKQEILTGGAINIKDLTQTTLEYAIGKKYNILFHNFTKNIVGKDAAGMLDLAHGINMNDRSYIKDVTHISSYNDAKIKQDRLYLEHKLSKQFKEYNFDITKIKGYLFKYNSETCQRLIKDNDFRNMILENKEIILKNKEFSYKFPKKGPLGVVNNNFRNAFGKTDFRHIFRDSQGNLHLKMYDTYDFNKDNNILIRAGRQQMKNGNLKPYFTIHDIIVPKMELEQIWQ